MADNPVYPASLLNAAPFVAALASSTATRSDLQGLEDTLPKLTKSAHLEILKTKNLLTGLSSFLSPAALAESADAALMALICIWITICDSSAEREPCITQSCKEELFCSSTFAFVIYAAVCGNNEITKQVLCILNLMALEYSEDLFCYQGVADVLLYGLTSKDECIIDSATVILSCCLTEDSYPDNDLMVTHPEIISSIVETFTAAGLSCRFGHGCDILSAVANTDEKVNSLINKFPGLTQSIEVLLEGHEELNLTTMSAYSLLSLLRRSSVIEPENGLEFTLLREKVVELTKVVEKDAREIAALRNHIGDSEVCDKIASAAACVPCNVGIKYDETTGKRARCGDCY
jgi:hypothetical protein